MESCSEAELNEYTKNSLKHNLNSFSGEQLERATKILDLLIECQTLLINDDGTMFSLFGTPIYFVDYLKSVTDDTNYTTNTDFTRVTRALILRGAPIELFFKGIHIIDFTI